MMLSKIGRATLAGVIAALALTATTADARTCKRLNKTQGAVVGAAAGGALGAVLTGGSTAGVLGGAAVGGVGGHERSPAPNTISIAGDTIATAVTTERCSGPAAAAGPLP